MSTSRIIGRFLAIIPEPIIASFDILEVVDSRQSKGQISLNIGESDVSVWLGNYTEPSYDELPTVKGFNLEIKRYAFLQCKTGGVKTLPRSEENCFEDVLVETVQRIATAIKRKTKQAFINTRHPVDSYEFAYFVENSETDKPFYFNDPAVRKLPRYALARFAFDSLGTELDAAMWTNLGPETNSMALLSDYDELIFNAHTFRDGLNFQMAALSAAIAIELMVNKVLAALLGKKCVLTKSQTKSKLGLKLVPKVRLINRLEPQIQLFSEEIRQVVKIRKVIAHGESLETSRQEMSLVIRTSHKVRRILAELDAL